MYIACIFQWNKYLVPDAYRSVKVILIAKIRMPLIRIYFKNLMIVLKRPADGILSIRRIVIGILIH